MQALVEKPPGEQVAVEQVRLGRYIPRPGVLTDANARLIGQQLFHAVTLAGRWFDCGSQTGFVEATVALALERAEIGAEVRAIAKRLLAW